MPPNLQPPWRGVPTWQKPASAQASSYLGFAAKPGHSNCTCTHMLPCMHILDGEYTTKKKTQSRITPSPRGVALSAPRSGDGGASHGNPSCSNASNSTLTLQHAFATTKQANNTLHSILLVDVIHSILLLMGTRCFGCNLLWNLLKKIVAFPFPQFYAGVYLIRIRSCLSHPSSSC